ncbi:hypothetical protein [Sulfurimonas sp. HSL-1716]|uniref:hypothetical protein n=1 Tax=Hydrocurvibacter sulfurireducens TaxID=3131937 RepID=UPI0031F72689
MLKLFILSVVFFFSFAKNPAVYSLLGDVVYNNVSEIKRLSDLSLFSSEKQNIIEYAAECEELKKKGFSIEAGDVKYDKMEYLSELRKLSKINDRFVRLANTKFIKSIDDNDIGTFKELIDLKIVNKQAEKEKIRNFISEHKAQLETTQYYMTYKEEMEKDKIEKERLSKQRNKNYAKEKYSNIERIRDKDKKRQESLKKELEKMVEDKKKQIYKQQKEGLQNY